MKVILVYYSLDGNTERIAKQIAGKTGADVVKIEPVKNFPKEGFKKFFLGGKSVIFRQKPKLKNPPIDFAPYDTVVIGTPVWAGGCSSPVYSALRRNRFEGKNVFLFACHASGSVGNCFETLTGLLKGNTIKATADFTSPLKDDAQSVAQRVEQFCWQLAK